MKGEEILRWLDSVTQTGEGKWMALCPAHDDQSRSLSIAIGEGGKVLLHCFAGCDFKSIREAIAERRRRGPEGGVSGPDRFPGTPQQSSRGLTLAEYAQAKQLPLDFLERLGLTQHSMGGRCEVRIPYSGSSGEPLSVRIRVSMGGEVRFRWAKGSKAYPYGLWRLKEGLDAGYLLVVEGETDAQTLWFHDIPAIGIPGAAIWKPDWATYLAEIAKIYVVQEPDRAGETFVRKVASAVPHQRLHVIRLGSAKDVSDLYLQAPREFRQAFKAAVDRAEPYQDLVEAETATRLRDLENVCADLLRREDLLDALVEDLARSGLVGEDRAAKLLYLVLTSRVLSKPVSAILRAQSSAGKSFIVDGVLRRFPATAFLSTTSMSEKALAYDDQPLKHRMLVFYEHAGMRSEFLNYCVRSLLSEGHLSYVFVEKTKDGTLRTRRVEREGPTGLILTSTRGIDKELATRMLRVHVNESSVQTKRIVDALARVSQSGESPADHDVRAWVALQEYVAAKPCKVVIPFAAVLAKLVQPTAVRLRRDFRQVLSLVKAHALLHQKTRMCDAHGRILATLTDYAAVIELVRRSIARGTQETVRSEIRETVAAVRALSRPGRPVPLSAIEDRLGVRRSTASRRVANCVRLGYLRRGPSKSGSPLLVQLGRPLPDHVDTLPDAQTLQRHCAVASESGVPDTPPRRGMRVRVVRPPRRRHGG